MMPNEIKEALSRIQFDGEVLEKEPKKLNMPNMDDITRKKPRYSFADPINEESLSMREKLRPKGVVSQSFTDRLEVQEHMDVIDRK